ncbi:hypothetical protein SKAU_G00312490 [Synaphobranchus kaupii]|uniref:EF-hand domain-containing protein n=1 Tax=Synaphobranchus kaupii TaxID=118154 RepID=A0A9Q1ERY4_SYNKA|nr:hypothetical protein SKAU_G00312490 [Synaphobranchus kaupii]
MDFASGQAFNKYSLLTLKARLKQLTVSVKLVRTAGLMESAIKTVVEVYLKSSKGKENLGPNDFQKLVKNQLHNIMSDTDSSAAIKEMRQGLDDNHDGKVSFQEYMTLVGYLANTLSEQRTQEKTAEKPEVVELRQQIRRAHRPLTLHRATPIRHTPHHFNILPLPLPENKSRPSLSHSA